MTLTDAPPTGLVLDMDEMTYHARPELSSTGVRKLLDSPARFRWDMEHRTESVAYDVGHAVHGKVLGVGSPVVPYPDEHLTPSGKPSTKAATAAWIDEQRAAGLVPIARADAELIDAMAEALLAHKAARKILEQPGHSEVSAFATDPETGVDVRARIDRLCETVAADVKTTAGSASPTGFGREAARYGYPIQEAHYAATLGWAGVGDDGPMPMAFVVVEKREPHLVAVHYFDEITRMVARELAATARATYARCLATNSWPGYGDEPLMTQVPGWWLDQADDQEDMVI